MASTTRARIEGTLLRTAARVEARRRGFETVVVDLDSLPVSLLRSARPGREAPVVVMLHGYSADKTVWMRFASHLATDYRILVPDLAGHGATPFRSGSNYSAAGQADLVRRLLDAHGVEAAHVVGSSMGGFVTATMASLHPDRVLSAGLVDPAGLRSPVPSELDRLRTEGRNPFFLDDVSRFGDLYRLTMSRPPSMPGFALRAMASDYVDRRAALEEIFEAFAEVDLLGDRLHEIACPTLLMWGSEDRIIDPSTIPLWTAGVPDLEVIIYDGVGHLPMVEIAKRSAQDYHAFLARIGR